MGGGAMLRSVGRVIGVGGFGVGAGAASATQQASCSACKSGSWNVAKVRASACVCHQGRGIATQQTVPSAPSWQLDDWEFTGGEGEFQPHHDIDPVIQDRLIFGSVPTQDEVKEAVSDLHDALSQGIIPVSGTLSSSSSVHENSDSVEISTVQGTENKSYGSLVYPNQMETRKDQPSMYLDPEQSGLVDALPSRAGGWELTRLLPRKSEESCHDTAASNTCEKSQLSGGKVMIAIIIVSVVVAIFFFLFLLHLHRRRTRMDKQEDLKSFQELDDYGMAAPSSSSKASSMPQAPAPAQVKQPASTVKREGPPPSYRESTDSLSPSIRGATAAVPRDGLSNR